MSAISVAKKDFTDTRRTKTLWIVVGLMTALGGLMAYVFGGSLEGADAETFKQLYQAVAIVTAIIIPIVAMIATYLAIAGERDSGSIKFMLSLPNSRLDMFVGKFLSRAAAVTATVLLMFTVVTGLLAVRIGALPLGFALGVIGILVLYSLTFVSVAIAMSSMVASRSRAIAGAVGAYFVMVILYVFPMVSITDVVRWAHHDLLGLAENPDLYDLVLHTSPFFALQKALNLVLPTDMAFLPFRGDRVSESAVRNADSYREAAVAVDLPLYLTDEFSLVILAFWIVVPLALGYWRFERADLG
jgi:ABC-2 type transport system permease protein